MNASIINTSTNGVTMNKDYALEIKPIRNGFIVEKTWNVHKDEANEFTYGYRSERYMLADWDAVVEWVKNNALETAAPQS